MFEEFINLDSNPETPDDESLEALPDATREPGSELAQAPDEDLANLISVCAAILDMDLNRSAHGLLGVIGTLEKLKSAIAAVQAMAATLLEGQVIAQHRQQKTYRTNPSYGTGAQLALARRESQDFGPRFLTYAKTLILDLPHTLGALSRGEISEQHAMIIARETQHLSIEERQSVDEDLMNNPRGVEGVGTKELGDRVKQLAYVFGSHDAVAVLEAAERRRYVAVYPSGGGTMTVHGVLPLDKGLALKQGLDEAAQALKSAGDERTLDQIRCDVTVERITGNNGETGTKILVNLVMTDRTLFQGESEPAFLQGYGTVPAHWARELIAGRNSRDRYFSKAMISLLKIYTAPGTGQLVAMDSRQREFPAMLKHLIRIRDQVCRTPYCNAPVKHLDHVLQHALDGPTSEANGAGKCAKCNQTKEMEGWSESVVPGRRHTLEIQTPYGYTYRSTAPPLPGTSSRE